MRPIAKAGVRAVIAAGLVAAGLTAGAGVAQADPWDPWVPGIPNIDIDIHLPKGDLKKLDKFIDGFIPDFKKGKWR